MSGPRAPYDKSEWDEEEYEPVFDAKRGWPVGKVLANLAIFLFAAILVTGAIAFVISTKNSKRPSSGFQPQPSDMHVDTFQDKSATLIQLVQWTNCDAKVVCWSTSWSTRPGGTDCMPMGNIAVDSKVHEYCKERNDVRR